jgi:hypothetical protein
MVPVDALNELELEENPFASSQGSSSHELPSPVMDELDNTSDSPQTSPRNDVLHESGLESSPSEDQTSPAPAAHLLGETQTEEPQEYYDNSFSPESDKYESNLENSQSSNEEGADEPTTILDTIVDIETDPRWVSYANDFIDRNALISFRQLLYGRKVL